MQRSSEQSLHHMFENVQNELKKLNIEQEQNEIELVLDYFNFDIGKTVAAFKNEEAKDILHEWTLSKKQNVHLHSETSTSKKYLNDCDSRENDDANCIIKSQQTSKKEDYHLSQEKKIHWMDLDLIQTIETYEKSIKDYEVKMEKCNNRLLLDYYIKSASDLRKQIILLLNIYEKKLTNDKIAEEIKNLSSKVDYLLKQNNHRMKHELDCWDTSSLRTKEEQNEFKNNLIIYYQCASIHLKGIKCMVLNKYFDRNLVRAVHIWKMATKGVGLNEFQLEESDVHNERNGLLLYQSIAKAFDDKKLCFLYNPFNGALQVKILSNDLRNIFIIHDKQMRINFNETRKFNDIDDAILLLPENIYPYRRLLNWHGRCSYKTAKLNKWIDENEHLEDFFHLSDLISLPGDDTDE